LPRSSHRTRSQRRPRTACCGSFRSASSRIRDRHQIVTIGAAHPHLRKRRRQPDPGDAAASGFGTSGIAVDQLTNDVYATDHEDSSVTTLDGNRRNGTDARGCGQTPSKVAVGDYPISIAVDRWALSDRVQDDPLARRETCHSTAGPR